jgi:hypothetical protein
MKLKVLIGGVAINWMMAQGATNLAAQGLRYEPTVVQLSGTLVIEDHYGPPNFGEEPGTDSKERALILKLDAPIDVVGDPTGTTNRSSFGDVRRIQLVGLQARKLTERVGQHATVQGTLFEKLSAGHLTDVLLDVLSANSKSRE